MTTAAVERMHLDVKRAQWGAAEDDGRTLEAEAYAEQVGDLLGRVHNEESGARRRRLSDSPAFRRA